MKRDYSLHTMEDEMVRCENRDRAVKVRIEALRAAAKVASPTEDIGNLIIHTQWLCQLLETGRAPEVDNESSVTGRIPVA